MRKEFKLALEKSEQIARWVKHFTFFYLGEEGFDFIPGQFITLQIPTAEKILRRSYSIANKTQQATHKVEFAASYVPKGAASDFLFGLQPGDNVIATGPFGRLILKTEESPERYILVATGTGVTPYRTMLSELERRFQQHPFFQVILLFGVRQPEDLLYCDEFLEFAKKNSWFQLRAYYSRVQRTQPLFYEYSGYVLKAFNEINPNSKQDLVYLCGNPNMVDDVVSVLINRYKFPLEKIRREKYISSS